MENGGDPATRAAGGMCDRFLTFLARNLTMSRTRSIADGPGNGAGDGHPPMEGVEEEDEFAIPIERADGFDYEFGGGHGDGGYSSVATVLEESAATTTTTTRDVPEPKTGAAATAADGPVAAEPAPPAVAVLETTKVRKTVTIKDRPEQEGGASAPATLERKKSLFKKRQASSASGAGGDGQEQQAPRRSGLRPRMPPVLRVPTNINERSSTFIEQRRRSFGRSGKPPAPDK